MKDFLAFLKSKQFLKHFLIALLSLVVVIWILFKLLNVYTQHGETAEVPDFKGKKIAELDNFIQGKNVRYIIIDSIYEPKETSGIVIKQDPEAKSEVKHNRMIYLYVTSTQPPQIAMPKLVDKSTRQALFMIESYGFKKGTLTEVAADCKGCVVRQLYKGKEIKPGDPIKKGSKIDLVIGRKEEGYVMPEEGNVPEDGNDPEEEIQ
jgi:beta-lactam-binding protein with PASTA domain